MTITEYLGSALHRSAIDNVDLINLLDAYILQREGNGANTKYVMQFKKFLDHEYGIYYTDEVTEEIFMKFLLYYIPKMCSFLTYRKSKQLLKEIGFFVSSERIKGYKGIRKAYNNVYYDLMEEFPRIMELQKALKNEMGYPVVGFDPLVVDLVNYRRERLLEKYAEKAPIMEQGYFQVLETFGSGVIIFKKLFSAEMYVKIHLGTECVPYIRKYDILHMRISRRLFFTTWNIDEVRSCYLKQAEIYLGKNNG